MPSPSPTRKGSDPSNRTMATTMEKLEQIRQTLGDIDTRVPDALRVALGFGYPMSSPTPAPGEGNDEVADFAASLSQPPATREDGAPTPTEHDATAAASALRIDWASCYVPLHDHDAHFGNSTAGVLGVADGVGSYADAGAFSRGLMASAAAEVAGLEDPGPGGVRICPCALLERAYYATAASGVPGASTAVILSLAGGNALEWAYVGDSAFAVLRGCRTVFLSTPQRHPSLSGQSHTSQKMRHFSTAARQKQRFSSSDDSPFQLSAGQHSDRVAEARAGQLAVRAGDVVVVGTDGLFDNILQEQLVLAVQMGTRLAFSPKNMADIIAGVAYERSNQTFSKRLRKGKPDDITVLVAFIVQSDL